MEGPQRCKHDGAQRRKILIMGPSAAGMKGPQRCSQKRALKTLLLRG